MTKGWYSHQELNLDQRFRKPLLYPFELWERPARKRYAIHRRNQSVVNRSAEFQVTQSVLQMIGCTQHSEGADEHFVRQSAAPTKNTYGCPSRLSALSLSPRPLPRRTRNWSLGCASSIPARLSVLPCGTHPFGSWTAAPLRRVPDIVVSRP